jgi:hypothetical protein
MIGHFKDATDATKAKELIDELTKQVRIAEEKNIIIPGSPSVRYDKDMLDLLKQVNVGTIGPQELEQFLYDFSIKVDDRKIVIETEEIDVSALLKLMYNKGARIEVYSAHTHPDTEYGRGK